MANFTTVQATRTIGATEYSIAKDASYSSGSPMATLGYVDFWIDFGALTAAETYVITYYAKANGGTQRVVDTATIIGATLTMYTPAVPMLMLPGGDITLKKTAGTDRSIDFGVIVDTNDVNVASIANGVIAAATFAASAITAIQAGLALAATALSTAQWTNGRAALVDNLDAAVSTRAASATAVSNVDLTPTRAANLDNLDTAVSTRASAATVAAATAALQADTDDLQSRLPAALAGDGSISASLSAAALTATAAAVWAAISEGAETYGDQVRLAVARLVGKATVQDGDGSYTFWDRAGTKIRAVLARVGTARTVTTRDGTP